MIIYTNSYINTIILIGNGFDLAHGLNTSYKDFIDDFWDKRKNEIKTSPYYTGENYSCIYDNDIFKIQSPCSFNNLPNSINTNAKGYDWFLNIFNSGYNNIINGNKISFKIYHKNIFLEYISKKYSFKYWVDIEEAYYLLLNECLKSKDGEYGIENLNKDFLRIKNELENYLIYQSMKDINVLDKINNLFTSIFQEMLKDKTVYKNGHRGLLFLNFNYTNTINMYKSIFSHSNPNIDVKYINIHGEIKSLENPIIFGYGDEIDDKYKLIEQKNDNKYLENIKSIKYLETRNYRNMLSFINSDLYQIYIMGHSCGISDRTLLNTLFENKNCKSIKVFYHKREDGSDNYSDVVRNISRNFTNKSLMREIVVDKTNCESLT